jgi:hypothetical protein
VSHHFTFDDGRQAWMSRCPCRYIWPAELDLMAQLAGFTLETRYADWAGSEFTADSRSFHLSLMARFAIGQFQRAHFANVSKPSAGRRYSD